MTAEVATALLGQAAQAEGFLAWGATKAEALQPEADILDRWLRQGQHGTMHWMETHRHLRTDPTALLPGAQSVFVVLLGYQPAIAKPSGTPLISTYAWGLDYHHVLRAKLARVAAALPSLADPATYRICVDSAPAMDKPLAARAGLGWVGKHTNLIRQGVGSFFFIGSLISTQPLVYGAPVLDLCGTCTRCLDACPTQALTPYWLDARRCISYLTIESKADTPPELAAQLSGWAFGCDICQQVCPWNERFSEPSPIEEFEPRSHIHLTASDWRALGTNQYRRLTRPTAMSRIPHRTFLKNLHHAGY
jgi:epoxyqueuosine reductase